MKNSGNLADLSDPLKFHAPIAIGECQPGILISQLRSMMTIRMAEQHLGEMRKQGYIGGPVHLGVGQEAIAVGVSTCLRGSDRVFSGHRSHAHLLALGGSIHGLFAEILGKDTGLSRGMGGSMHLWDQANGFYGSVPIVAGTVPLAVGAGLAARMTGSGDVGLCYFGDGAVEEGVVHESLNLARMLKAPTIFVVENNLFASHMHVDLRQPRQAMARFAQAHDIGSEIVDGNDVVAIAAAAARLVDRARKGGGPGFLEAITYRWYGHVDWREDIDVGVNRSIEDLANWRKRDPIRRLVDGMKLAGIWSDEQQESLESECRDLIGAAWAEAMNDPWPQAEALLDRVYSTGRKAGA